MQKMEVLRQQFLDSLAIESAFYRMFNEISDLSFFAKNREGVLLFASRGILERYGYTSESEIIGKTDFELNPSSFAKAYVQDDKRIHSTGKIIRNRLEPWFNRRGLPEWHVTTKYPLFNRKGKIVGIMGIIFPVVDTDHSLPGMTKEILPSIKYLSTTFREPINTKKLAERCGFSVRKLQYRFKECFDMTVQEFVMRLRIDYACKLMEDQDRNLANIASDCGFSDQSAFTRKFRELMKMTPLRYRRSWE